MLECMCVIATRPPPPHTLPMQINDCTMSAMCDPRFSVQAASTVAIQIIDGPSHENFCTGTLVPSYDGKKTYVLTADHCFNSKYLPSAKHCAGLMAGCAWERTCTRPPPASAHPLHTHTHT